MAGGGKVPDIGVQHPSNQNMMQMDNAGTKGVNLPNSPDVPQGIQNPAHPTQPGTAITQPSQPGQPYNNQPNQVNPNPQPNAPSSPQHTPLQNNTRTVYSANNPPSVTDNIVVTRRPVPNYTPEELERFRNYTADWHKRDDWPVEVHDLLYGHGAKIHVYSTWQETADRVINPQPGARIPTASSRTLTIEYADRLVKETLRHNGNDIDLWLGASMKNDRFKLIYTPGNNQITGFGISRGGDKFLPTYKMTVELMRTKRGYIIDKFYPSF
jgi:hypothetical protein